MDTSDIRAAARALYAQHRERRELTALPGALAPATIDDAYRVQDALLRLYGEHTGEPLAGWKIALTTPVMQSFVGVDHPLAGAILRHRVYSSPATLVQGDYVNLGVEAEIAVRLASDVPARDAPHDRDTIAAHVAGCMAALEVVDDRRYDYGRPDARLLIADNAFNFGCVLGPEMARWRELDLAAARGSMRINGVAAGSGTGGDVLGHPLQALAWLANHLPARGRRLRTGDIVLTGSIVTTRWLTPGDEAVSEVEGLGTARLSVR